MKNFHKLSLFVAGLSTSVVLMGSGLSLAATSASFSLSPAGASENVNSTFVVNVYENGNGNPVNVATANLSYDQAMLQFIGANCGGAFSNTVSASGGGGSISLSCYTAPGAVAPTDTQLVGSVSFKALSGSGTTSVSFVSGSMIASNGVNLWDGGTAGGSFSLRTPAAVVTNTAKAPSTGTNTDSTAAVTPVTTTIITPKPSNKSNRHQAPLTNSTLVATNSGLSTRGDWASIVAATIVVAVIIVFRQKVVTGAKDIGVKYQLYRRK